MRSRPTSSARASASTAWHGLDVSFADVDLVTESLDDGLAVVTLAGGSASWTFDPAAFPLGADLRDALADELAVTTDAASFAELDEPLRLATVERDGRWYVSVSYTVAEYARRASGLELPATPLTAVGADSPEAAADEFYSNLVSLDLAGVLASAAPGEGDAVAALCAAAHRRRRRRRQRLEVERLRTRAVERELHGGG